MVTVASYRTDDAGGVGADTAQNCYPGFGCSSQAEPSEADGHRVNSPERLRQLLRAPKCR